MESEIVLNLYYKVVVREAKNGRYDIRLYSLTNGKWIPTVQGFRLTKKQYHDFVSLCIQIHAENNKTDSIKSC